MCVRGGKKEERGEGNWILKCEGQATPTVVHAPLCILSHHNTHRQQKGKEITRGKENTAFVMACNWYDRPHSSESF